MLPKKTNKIDPNNSFSLNLKKLVNIDFNPPQYHWMKGIVDLEENIKTKKNISQRSMWKVHGPLLTLQKELLKLFDG